MTAPHVEVVIPAARGNLAERLVWSLSQQIVKPDLVTVVGNEAGNFDGSGLPVRLARYTSERWNGPGDTCLRRNIGIFWSKADIIIFQDDDQMAPPGMIRSALPFIDEERYVWGHHRFIDFESPDFTIQMPPQMGRSRENSANRLHGWQSCYAGMFGAKRSLLLELGGFDMVFHGRIGNEDQQLGRRLLRMLGQREVYIHEPPFAWHPTEVTSLPVPDPKPFDFETAMSAVVPIQPFDPSLVSVTFE